jgi:hypothetical protein
VAEAAAARSLQRPLRRAEVRQDAEKAQKLVQRYEVLKQQRSPWEFDWQDIVRYLVPGADDILDLRETGDSRTTAIFDAHPLRAPQVLAANMMGAVTNPSMAWRKLKFRDERLNDIQAVSQWLDVCDQRLMAAYGSSNFYQAVHTFYVNLGAFGTGAMYAGSVLAERGEGYHLHFKTLPTGSYVIAENPQGLVDTLLRDVWLTPRQAVALFRGQVSSQVHDLASKPTTQDHLLLFVHCVYPRADRNPRRYDNTNMPFAGVYLEHTTKFINEETGYQEFPYLVARWETLAKAPYGYGPGHLALPDVRMLNLLRELNMQQLALWVQPPLKALREGVVGNISTESLAINVLTQMDALQPLDLTGRPDLVQISQEDLRRSIDDVFLVNALQALPPPEASNMTAYEVAQRTELMTRTMGPVFYRLLAEFLTPLEDRAFGLAWRAGALPPPPRDVLEAAARNQGQMDVEYAGPLARSQRGEDIRSLQDYMRLTMASTQAQQNLTAIDLFDWDAALRAAAEVLGLQAYRRDEADVTRMRQARAQQQALLQQAQMQNERMAALGRAAPMAQQLTQASQGQQGAA